MNKAKGRTQSRMGGMSLGAFSGASSPQSEQSVSKTPVEPTPKAKTRAKRKKAEELVPVNIKLPKRLRDWFREQAEQVRSNNESPVPADERVYPQHLMQIAGELLQSSEIDWKEVRSADDLRRQLGI